MSSPFDNYRRISITDHVAVDVVDANHSGWFSAVVIESKTPPKHEGLHGTFVQPANGRPCTMDAAIDASLLEIQDHTPPTLMPFLKEAMRIRCLPIPGELQQLPLF